jgi:hypothetical protein
MTRVVEIGSDGLDYMRDAFVKGRTLSHQLLTRTNLDRGRVFTVVPPSADVALIGDFTSGLTPPDWDQAIRVDSHSVLIPIPNMYTDLAGRIEEFLGGGSGRLSLLENPINEARDVADVDSGLLTLGGEVYHILLPSVVNRQEIRDTVAWASSIDPPTVGILTYGTVSSDARRATTTTELHQLAARATTIFVSAYHGEAFIYWEGLGESRV